MLRIAALNESDSGEEELEKHDGPTTTREAEEAEAFAIYNRSLGLQRSGDGAAAEELLSSLLGHPFLQQASDLVGKEMESSHHPGLPLLYLVHKNLAAMAIARDDLVQGMKSYLEAVKIDSSEVTVWYKMGIIAKKLHNYPLAKLAFEQGLQCNENHWPCLDSVITVLYALNDYWMCLDYIGRALERDCHYTKGLVFHRQILKEQPSLISETKEMFAYCDPAIHSIQVDEEEAKEFIREAVQIREKRRELAKKPPPPPLKLPKPITELTWKCVGECLVELFDTFTSSDPPKSLMLSLDLSEYREMAGCSEDKTKTKPSAETSVSQPSPGGAQAPSTSDVKAAPATEASVNSKTEASGGAEAGLKEAQTKTEKEMQVSDQSSIAGEVHGEQPMEVEEGKDVGGEAKAAGEAVLTEEQQNTVPINQADSSEAVKIRPTDTGSDADAKSEMTAEESLNVTVKSEQLTDTSTSTVTADSEQAATTSKDDGKDVTLVTSQSHSEETHASVVPSPGTTTTTTVASLLLGGGDESKVAPGASVKTTNDHLESAKTSGSDVAAQQSSSVSLATTSIAGGDSVVSSIVTSPVGCLNQTQTTPAASVTHASRPAPVVTHASSPSPVVTHASSPSPVVTHASGPAPVVTHANSSAPVVTHASSPAPLVTTPSTGPLTSTSPLQVVISQDNSNAVTPKTADGRHVGDHTYTFAADSAPQTTAGNSSSTSTGAASSVSSASAASGILAIASTASQSEAPAHQQTVPATAGDTPALPSQHSSSSGSAVTGSDMQSVSSSPKSSAQASEASPKPLLSALVASVPLQTLPSSLPPIQIPLPSDLRLSPLSAVSTLTPTPAHVHPSPPKTSSGTTPPPPAHSSVSPSLPKFQFSTITTRQVQALLQDPLPSTPLLSTLAPSAYSPNMAERLRQMTSLSQPASSSPSTTATAQLQSLARLANLTNSLPMTSHPVVTTGHTSVEQTPETNSSPVLSAAKKKGPLSHSTPVSAEGVVQDSPGSGKGSRGTRRGAKRKRTPVEDLSFLGLEDFVTKRRSARVRNTRKEEENVDFQKLLRNFLPSTLTGTVQVEEDTQTEDTSMSVSQMQADTTSAGVCMDRPLVETETDDVRQYLAECVKGQSAMGMMYKYLVHLSSRDMQQWPEGVALLYCKVYDRIHPHLTFPSLYCMDFPEVCYSEMAKMALVWCELSLDTYLVQKTDSIMSPSMPQKLADGGAASSPFASDKAISDVRFITGMVETGPVDLLGDEAARFTIRVYWSKARLAMAENQMDKAVENLEMVAHCLEEGDEPSTLYLPNCTQDKLISLEEVKRQQESLQRCQSLEETQRLFDAGQFQQVVDYLTPTFAQSQTTQPGLKRTMPDPERHAQLELLQDALFRLEDWGQCLLWGEVALNESLHHYRRAPTIPARDKWALTLVRLFQSLQRVLDKDPKAVGSLPSRSSVRFVQNLMKIIEINHDVSDAVTEMPISSVLPWILLYRVIRHEEEKLNALKLPDESQEEMDGAISSSLMLLNVAHEYLGRHAWCTRDSGVFLLFYMDVLAVELSKANESVKDDLETAFEQCVLCLYKHPNKKGKARHLFDHNATPVDLTWDKCEVVFEYFKPKTVPEFDSYKTSTVSAELENLLHRIYMLIPEDVGPGKRVDQVREYIEGNTNVAPNFSTESPILQELYYLLADYYFKNKEPAKAIKYYQYDVCFNSWRLDSWAGLALAKNCQIEQKLNSMELKIDAPFHRKSIAALRCFSRAVEIDESVRKLWIEYGALAYQLHSHASRQLRMELWFPLTTELLEIAKETRVEMLATARNCYWKASECEAEGSEEEWLHHYMMGKVMEKKRTHPRLYLEHYKQAAIYLHEEEAKYPRKILYQHSPPHLSLEALEMYYRLHVAVMKQLLRSTSPETRGDMALFDRYVTEATESPFARREEKRAEMRESVSSVDDADSQLSSIGLPPYSTAHQKPVYHMTPQDHNYSKQKSSGGETSDASCGLKETLTETEGSQSGEEIDTLMASEIQSQDSADDNDQSSVIAAPPKDQRAAKPGGTAAEISVDGSVSMETSSQANEGRIISEPKKDETASVSGAQGGKEGQKVSSGRVEEGGEEKPEEMVELHAETDSQVAGEFVDTKPLLFDKQVSGGFEPHFDRSIELKKSDSERSEKSEPPLLETKEKDSAKPPQGLTTHQTVAKETAQKSENPAPVSAVVESQGEASSQTTDQHAQNTSSVPVRKASSLDVPAETDPSDLTPDDIITLNASSLELEELSQEEDVVSTQSSSVICITDSDDAHPGAPVQKRPLQPDLPSTKRARLELDKEKESSGARGEKEVVEVGSEEGNTSVSALHLTSGSGDHPMEVDQGSSAVPGRKDAREGGAKGNGEAEASKPSAFSATADAPGTVKGKKSAGVSRGEEGDPSLTAEIKTDPEKSPVSAVDRNSADPSVTAVETGSGPSSDKPPLSGTASGNDKLPDASAPMEVDSTVSKTTDVKREEMQDVDTEADDVILLSTAEENVPANKEGAQASTEGGKQGLSSAEDKLLEKKEDSESKKPLVSKEDKEITTASEKIKEEPGDLEKEKSEASTEKGDNSKAAEKTAGLDVTLTDTGADQTQNESASEQKDKTSDEKDTKASRPDLNTSPADAKPSQNTQSAADADKSGAVLSETEFQEWKVRLLDKCVAGLHLCLSRFPTHYKSIYRLAHLYYVSKTHRNLEHARDLLLGNPDWQKLSHMPANGLFAERRGNNFFQGTWKIPIDEIDRAGSFASHINRSVQLLLDVLRDLGDVRMLLSLHTQLRKKPDQGRKYLRDGERQVLARMAHSYVLDAVARQLERPETEVDKTEVLLLAFRAHTAHRNGAEARRAIMLLVTAYQRLGLPQHGFGPPVEQALQYCQALLTSEAQAMTAKSERSRNLSTSSFTASTPTETTSTGVGTTSAVPRSPALEPGEIPPPSVGAPYLLPGISSPHSLAAASLPLGHPQMSSAAGALPAHFNSPPAHGSVPRVSASDGPAALDLTSPKKQSGDGGSRGSVVDLTSPVRGQLPYAATARQNLLPPGSYPSVSTPGHAYPLPAWSTAGQVTPQRNRHPSSPYSSPSNYPSSGLSATPTPRRHTSDDVTDIDLTSDPGDDLAVTSPDKLTSDVRHHFHGDIL